MGLVEFIIGLLIFLVLADIAFSFIPIPRNEIADDYAKKIANRLPESNLDYLPY